MAQPEKGPAPTPFVSISVQPPAKAFVSHEQPLYLPCEANYTGTLPIPDEDFDFEVDDDETRMDPNLYDSDSKKRNKMRDVNFDELLAIENSSVATNDGDGEAESFMKNFSRTRKRDVASRTNRWPTFEYRWYRNHQLIVAENVSEGFRVFSNGTLRIDASPLANGRYRCVASCSVYDTGAIASIASHVQQASKFYYFHFWLIGFWLW